MSTAVQSAPAPLAVTLTVSPATATVATGGKKQFSVAVQNAGSTAVQWGVNRVPGGGESTGTVDSNGLYSAPATAPASNVEVTAMLQADASKFGIANVTVLPPISVSPRFAAITTSQKVQFSGTGADGNGVNWSANAPAGLFNSTGAGVFTVTATSKADSTVSASATVYVTDFAGNLSWRNDAGLTGQNLRELALSPVTVKAGSFGKQAGCGVDGAIYAQPLYAPNVNGRNIVYIATEHDSVYAFDADAVPCGDPIWHKSFVDPDVPDVTPVRSSDPDINNSETTPEIGITGTPVIDRVGGGGTLYVVAMTKEQGTSGDVYVHRLHALNILTGEEKTNSPVLITAHATGSGEGSDGLGTISFDSSVQNQRAGLQLLNGRLYVAFTGQNPSAAFHGWLLVYDATNLTQLASFATTPDASKGGISSAPSADSNGNIFLTTGQGLFDQNQQLLFRKNFGQTVIKLKSAPLSIADLSKDTFTPFDQGILTARQKDFGATGALILPDSAGSAANPRLAIIGGSDSSATIPSTGVLYLLDRDNMGSYTAGGPDKVLNKMKFTGALMGSPAFSQNMLFVAAAGDSLKAFSIANGILASAASMQSTATFNSFGASPVVSSNNSNGGIVWVLDTSGAAANPPTPAVLHAYDATNLARELYNSSVMEQDAAGAAVKLSIPTVANGRVYVGSQAELTIYGLLP